MQEPAHWVLHSPEGHSRQVDVVVSLAHPTLRIRYLSGKAFLHGSVSTSLFFLNSSIYCQGAWLTRSAFYSRT